MQDCGGLQGRMFWNTCWGGFAEGKAHCADLLVRAGLDFGLGRLCQLGFGKLWSPYAPCWPQGPAAQSIRVGCFKQVAELTAS